MRTIIAGSRSKKPTLLVDVYNAVEECGWVPTVVLCGMAKGVDTAGYNWAKQCNVPIEEYPASWTKFGKGAGRIRNIEMALKADALIAIWDGVSKGTGHMIDCARSNNLKIHVYFFDDETWRKQ